MAGKLVRDKIPDLIIADGRKPVFKSFYGNPSQLQGLLVNKLYEEVKELNEALSLPSGSQEVLEECADVIEVVLAIAEIVGHRSLEVFATAKRKNQERGTFSRGYYLEAIL